MFVQSPIPPRVLTLPVLSVSAVLGLACARHEPPAAEDPVPVHHTPPAVFEVGFAEELKLSDESPTGSVDRRFTLSVPSFVRTDSQGNVFVADRKSLKVLVFDRAGNYQRALGRRGREPGEFLYISCLHVDDDDHVLVADGLNQRITRLRNDGELVSVHETNPRSMLWPQRLQQVDDERYLFLYKMPARNRRGKRRPDAEYLFHLYDKRFKKKVSRFAAFEDAVPYNRTVDHFMQGMAGHFLVEDGGVLYAPSLYRGHLIRYEERDGRWVRAGRLAGYVDRPEPYEPIESVDFAGEPSFRATTQRGMVAAVLYNESRGLFRLNDGRLAHFTLITEGGERVFGVEIFDTQGTLEGYGRLERLAQPPVGSANLPVFVEWKDTEDRFYLRDGRDVSSIRVVRLSLSPASGEARMASLHEEMVLE